MRASPALELLATALGPREQPPVLPHPLISATLLLPAALVLSLLFQPLFPARCPLICDSQAILRSGHATSLAPELVPLPYTF